MATAEIVSEAVNAAEKLSPVPVAIFQKIAPVTFVLCEVCPSFVQPDPAPSVIVGAPSDEITTRSKSPTCVLAGIATTWDVALPALGVFTLDNTSGNPADADGDTEAEGETDADGEADRDALDEGETEGLALLEGELDGLELDEGLSDALADPLGDTLADPEALTDALGDTLGLFPADGDSEAEALDDGDTLAEAERLDDGEALVGRFAFITKSSITPGTEIRM